MAVCLVKLYKMKYKKNKDNKEKKLSGKCFQTIYSSIETTVSLILLTNSCKDLFKKDFLEPP